jgi:hypothetical protein
MNQSLAEQLAGIKLNIKDYGQLPQNDQLYLLTKILPADKRESITKKWDMLGIMRKNLIVLDKYLRNNKDETLAEWLSNNNENIAQRIYDELGSFNDGNKGISVYFLNLQKLYDEEEKKYDDLENAKGLPDSEKAVFEPMREDRASKRDVRRKARKLLLKDFKKNNQGYLIIEEENNVIEPVEATAPEPKEEVPTPTAEDVKETTETAEQVNQPKEEVHEAVPIFNADAKGPIKKNITVWLVGAAIVLTAIVVIAVKEKDKGTS